MNTKSEVFFNYIKGKKVGFIGVGVSHRDLIKIFSEKGAIVSVRDKNSKDKINEYNDFCTLGIKMILGDNYLENIDEDIIFRTPGMDFFHPVLQKAIKDGVTVTSEMEVFLELCPCKVYAITGSDGKTTTTTLISEMLKNQGKKVYLGGNIGRALLPFIEQITPDDRAVVELSSFQLMSMRCCPDISVVTNVTPNHLNVHGTMEAYIEAKKNVFTHQTAFTKTILNEDNDITNSFKGEIRGKLYTFSRKSKPVRGAYLDEKGVIHMIEDGVDISIMNKDTIRIPGIHNVENYIAAITAVWGEVDVDSIVDVAKNFGGVEHRIEFVKEIDGVKWYNDSIATSPTRTIAGLNSFNKKLIVIAGGYDKKISFEPLAPIFCEKVKLLILTGATAQKIHDCVKFYDKFENSGLEIVFAKDMQDAITIASEKASDGDIVSLSPACASFDSYPNFEERGRHFKSLVNKLV